MLRFISLRVAFSIFLGAALLPAAAFAQSQDSQSVAEAARRAREQKKTAAKPARVVTDDDVKPASPASSESTPAASAQAPSAANSPAAQSSAGSSGAQEPKDEKSSKEIADLKEEIKQALNDLDVLQRQLSLEQDNYFSQPDYTQDTAGKTKVDGIKQQANDKQQELDRLKARLAELQPSKTGSTTAPPKS
jgi:hypothetical protein